MIQTRTGRVFVLGVSLLIQACAVAQPPALPSFVASPLGGAEYEFSYATWGVGREFTFQASDYQEIAFGNRRSKTSGPLVEITFIGLEKGPDGLVNTKFLGGGRELGRIFMDENWDVRRVTPAAWLTPDQVQTLNAMASARVGPSHLAMKQLPPLLRLHQRYTARLRLDEAFPEVVKQTGKEYPEGVDLHYEFTGFGMLRGHRVASLRVTSATELSPGIELGDASRRLTSITTNTISYLLQPQQVILETHHTGTVSGIGDGERFSVTRVMHFSVDPKSLKGF